MITVNNPNVDPVHFVWVAFSTAAIAFASYGSVWGAAVCAPIATILTWLITTRRSRRDADRLQCLANYVSSIARDEPQTGISRESEHDLRDQCPMDRLDSSINLLRDRVRRTQQQQAEAMASLKANLNAIGAPVIATDESGRVTLLNRAARGLLTKRPFLSEGVQLEDLIVNSALLELHARAERGEACTKQIRLTINGVWRIYEVAAIPVNPDTLNQASRRSGVVLTIKDVHELAQTLQLRTDFAANASHELRTPIASLRAALETMRGPARDDPDMREHLVGVLENNVARLEEMVSDLLDLSHLESESQTLRVESFDLEEMAEALNTMFEPVCRERRLSIEFSIEPTLRRLRTDRKLVLLILRNLIDNATKFAFEETTIRVTGSPTADKLGARFAVSDTGIGIPLKHQQRIFERFYQVDESRARVGTRRGSGLGLAIVRHALRRLDGDISVESVWQEGTTMTVEIPRCVEIAEQ